MDICTAFIADPQPTKLSTPSVGPFYDPAVPTETILRLDPASGDARFDPSASAGAAAPGIVVSFVGVQLGRAAARPAARPGNRQHAIEQLLQDLRIVNVGSRQAHGQRNALSIDEKMMLRARFALVRRVGTRRSAPFSPPPWRSPPRHGSSRCLRLVPTPREEPGADAPRRRRVAIPGVVANRSSRCHIPSLAAASPRESRCAARTRSRSMPHDPEPAAVRLSASPSPAAAAGRFVPTTRRSRGGAWTIRVHPLSRFC